MVDKVPLILLRHMGYDGQRIRSVVTYQLGQPLVMLNLALLSPPARAEVEALAALALSGKDHHGWPNNPHL